MCLFSFLLVFSLAIQAVIKQIWKDYVAQTSSLTFLFLLLDVDFYPFDIASCNVGIVFEVSYLSLL